MNGRAAATLSGRDVGVFASDIHLDDHDPATAAAFFDRLRSAAADASHVFLLGDLFETWIGDDDDTPLADRTRAELAAIVRDDGPAQGRGDPRRLYLMRGNRDFLLDQQGAAANVASFSAGIGATMLDDPTLIDVFGEAVLLGHGDAWCSDDHDYQRFRAQTRTTAWARAFLARTLAERRAIAADLRARSRAATQDKAAMIMDVNAEAIREAMRAAGVGTLVHGHTHRPARHVADDAGSTTVRWVLPDWDAAAGRGGLLRVDADGWRPIGDWLSAGGVAR